MQLGLKSFNIIIKSMEIDIVSKIYIALSIVVLYLLFKTAVEWKKGLDRKNLSLMQLYLELKFLYKNLAHSTQSSSSENFCIELMLSIKEYYNLEEIMVIDSIHMEFKTRAISLLKKEVYNFLPGNLISLKEKFKTTDIVVLNATINNRKYILYIAELAQGIDCNGFIICVENFPSLLSKNELLGLESNINLLKTRLFYN
jgi:hypothetical protein